MYPRCILTTRHSRALHTLLLLGLLAPLFLARESLAASCVSPPAGLISWWTADVNPNDFIGTNHGTLLGGATAGSTGLVGGAFTFNGTNAYVQIPDAPSLRPTNLTIEAWVRFSGLDSAGLGGSPPGEQYIVFKKNSRVSSFEGFDLGKIRVSGTDRFRFQISSAAGATVELRSTTAVSTGVWYHVAGVRGPGSMQLYVNSQLQAQATIAFPQDYASTPLYFG